MSRKADLRLHDAIFCGDVATVKSLFRSLSLLKELNFERRTPLHLLALGDCGVEGDEEVVELAKILLGVAEDGSITQEGKEALEIQDKEGHTPLHLAVKNCVPSLVEAFLKCGANPLGLDAVGRTPLHYAAENGDNPKGWKCVELLLQTSEPISNLCEIKDKNGKSAFMLAISNCRSSTIEKYFDPNTGAVGLSSRLGKDEMTLLYKHCPLVLKRMMDLAVTQSSTQKEGVDVLDIDYGPIVGYKDEGVQAEGTYLYLAQWWEFEVQKEIIGHPLVKLYLARKSQRMRGLIFYGILTQIYALAAYVTLMHSVYFKEWENPWSVYLPAAAIFFKTFVFFGTEMLKLRTHTLEYFVGAKNWLTLGYIVIGFVPIVPVVRAMITWAYDGEFNHPEPSIIETYCTAVTIVMASTLAMIYFGGFIEAVGYFTEMLRKVLHEIIKVLLCFAPLVVGFTYAFRLVFVNIRTVEATFLGPLVNIIVMMTGELDYKETFDGGESTWDMRARLALFFLFLITIPIACFNLITGVALERVMHLKDRMHIITALKKLVHLTHIEFVVIDILMGEALCCWGTKRRRNMLRKFNVAVTQEGKGDLDCEASQKESLPKGKDEPKNCRGKGDLIFNTLQEESFLRWENRPASLKERLTKRIKSWLENIEIDHYLRNELRDLAAENSKDKDLKKLDPSVVSKVKKALMRGNE